MEEDRLEETLIGLLHRDLSQARTEAHRWEREAVRIAACGCAVVLALLAASMTPSARPIVLALPFIIIFGACQLGLLDARTRALRIQVRALEQRLNRSLGGNLFVTHMLDAAHDAPPDTPSLLGISLVNPGSFRSIYGVHLFLVSLVLFVVSTYRSLDLVSMSEPFAQVRPVYPLVMAAWASIHLVVLIGYWGTVYQEKKTAAVARDVYGIGEPSVEERIFSASVPQDEE